MEYRIFPSIGIARLGDSDEVFVGPEVIGSRGRELGGMEATLFKDATFRVRKQAARFHVFQRADDGSPWVPLPAGVVHWTVDVANAKDAIRRLPDPPDPDFTTPTLRIRPVRDPSRSNRFIEASATIGSNADPAASQPLSGLHVGNKVKLGELRVDGQGRLLILGGDMVSSANPSSSPIGPDFYNNPNWHDDVGDGPVSAEISLPDGSVVRAIPAWVILTPPDFAPGADPVVTLFDEILQVAIDQHLGGSWVGMPAAPSFTRDIYPIIRRARSLGWVHVDIDSLPGPPIANQQNWANISQQYTQLNDPSGAAQSLRAATRDLIKNVQALNLLSDYRITARQLAFLDQWVAGKFSNDWAGVPPVAPAPTAESLTRAALEGAVGQGFFPGIEAGRILADPSIYLQPFDFRIDPSAINPGDVTAYMAQPWQADFLKCAGNWWPSQRPDLAPQPDGTFLLWQRPLDAATKGDHRRMVEFVKKFGMITVESDADGVQISAAEVGRDPTLPIV